MASSCLPRLNKFVVILRDASLRPEGSQLKPQLSQCNRLGQFLLAFSARGCFCVRNVDGMKLSRHQVIGSLLLALLVLALLVVRAWPLLFPK